MDATAKDVLGKKLSVTGPYLNDELLTQLDTSKVGQEYQLEYRVWDEKRNIKGTKKLVVRIVDTEPPVIKVNGKTKSFTFTQPLEKDNLEQFDVEVTDNSSEDVDMKVTSTVSHLKGKGTITYLAKDKSGNITALVVTVNVTDKKNPMILKVDGNPKKYQSQGAILKVSQVNYLGDTLEYSFDGGKTWQKENQKEITENGIISIKVRDMFGNESDSWEEEVTTVDLVAPSIPEVQLKTSDWRGKDYDGNWTNQEVYTLLNSKDEESAIDYYEYSTDQVNFEKMDKRMYVDDNIDQNPQFQQVNAHTFL